VGSGLADALFSRVRQRLLGLLFVHPERSFYTNEIIEWAGSGSGAVQRELARLVDVGLVVVTTIGRQKHYQANADAPIFAELRSIVLKTIGLRDVLHEALRPFRNEIGAALVFGSIAKGMDTASSDVDLLVVSDQLTYPDLLTALEAASDRLARRVNPRIYTSDDFRRRIEERSPVLLNVLAGPKIWIIGTDDDLPAR
jgi:predicted nucleotidyltransferase